MTNKERYRKFCAANTIVPVFSHPVWLDAVAENWDVCLICEDKKIIAALPYCWKGNLFTKRIYLPDVSFYQSVLFFGDADKNMKQQLTEKLLLQLPNTVKSYFKFLPEHHNIQLSKYGFEKDEYNTYTIPKEQSAIIISTNHKRNIQKGNKLNYSIRESKHTEQSFALLIATFERQHIKPKITLADFKKLNALAKKHSFGKTLDCIDTDKNLLASVFVAEDNSCTYYLFGGYDTNYKNSGAMTFLLNHVIRDAHQRKADFNFCGSSKKSIAAYFEGFGATKTKISIWKKSIL